MTKKKTKTIRQKFGEIRDAALEYHRRSPPGKLTIHSTKPLTNQYDLALAYSPGVAAACEEIVRDPAQASMLTTRGNLVAVISNGTAVLGLGPIGKLTIHSTKPLTNQYDLALAYSPGVAAACEEIVRDPAQASMLPACVQTGHGREGSVVQEILRHRRVRPGTQ